MILVVGGSIKKTHTEQMNYSSHYTESNNDSETDSENVDSDNDDTDNDDTDTLPIEPSDDAADCEPPAKRPRVG